MCFGLTATRLGRLVWVITVALCVAGAARGQPVDDVPRDVRVKVGALSAEETALIGRFLQARLPKLTDASPVEIRKARADILRQLDDPSTSVPFRLEFSRLLQPGLEDALKNARDTVVVNALRIAGSLGTERGADLVRQHLEAQKESVRYAAAFAAGRTFDAAAGQFPAMDARRLEDLIRQLETRLTKERNSVVSGGVVTALVAAARVGGGGGQALNLKSPAFLAMCRGISARVKDLGGNVADAGMAEFMVQAMGEVRQLLAPNAQNPLSAEALQAGRVLASETLQYIARIVKDERLAPIVAQDDEDAQAAKRAARRQYVDLAQAAVNAFVLGAQISAGPEVTGLPKLLEAASKQDDAKFILGVGNLPKAP